MSEELAITLRPARLGDVPAHTLINAWRAGKRVMLARSQSELFETIRDFQVAEAEVGGVVGCTALHIDTATFGEIKSLAIAEAVQGRGIGGKLVRACIDEAARIGLERVFCLTYQVDFFAHLGFVKVDRSRLPEKVWGECIRCHRFLDCDETAMWIKVPAFVSDSV